MPHGHTSHYLLASSPVDSCSGRFSSLILGTYPHHAYSEASFSWILASNAYRQTTLRRQNPASWTGTAKISDQSISSWQGILWLRWTGNWWRHSCNYSGTGLLTSFESRPHSLFQPRSHSNLSFDLRCDTRSDQRSRSCIHESYLHAVRVMVKSCSLGTM